MIVRVRIKGVGRPYEYITDKSYQVGDKVLVPTYRNDVVGVEGTIVEINAVRKEKGTVHRIKGRAE